MTNTIWIHYARPRPHWYALDAEEKAGLLASWDEVRAGSAAAGARFEGRYHIRGQHDFETVEIWRFKAIADAFDHWTALCSARYNEYFAFSNNVGLEN